MKNLIERYGEWALITGASSGIGKEFANYLAKQKINLVIIARRLERLKELSLQLSTEYGIEVIPVQADLTKEESIKNIVEKVGHRKIGILVNNAGSGSIGLFSESDFQKQVDLLKLNCIAPTILTYHFTKQMIENKKGAVIFLGSIVGLQPTPYLAVYSATKSYNVFLANALWYELKKYNIDVLALSPGGTNTEFERVSKDSGRMLIAQPEEVVITAFNALGKKPSVVHGFINKLLIVVGKYLPNEIAVYLTGKISYNRNFKKK